MPLCHSSRATVRSHGPPFSPYLARTALVSTPGRKCTGVVPSGTDSTGTLRSSIARTSSARSAVHRLIATTTAALPMMLAAVPRGEPARRISGRLQLGTPDESRPPLLRERARAPRPEREPLHRAQPCGANADAIDGLREAS